MIRLARHIGRWFLKALKLSAIRIAALLAFAAGAAFILPPASAGLEAAGPGGSLVLEILGAGFEGYFDDDGPTGIHYRVRNQGPARKIVLSLERLTKENHSELAAFDEYYAKFRQQLDLPAGAVREGRLTVFNPAYFFMPKTRNTLVAKYQDGTTAARAVIPDLKSGSPVLILVREPRDAAHIQTALLLYAYEGGSAAPNVAVAAGRAPRIWHEYTPAKTVILARKWAGLESAQRKALTRWVSGGGKLIIAPGCSPDWRSAPWGGLSKTWGRYGMGEISIIPAGLESGARNGIDEKSLGGWFVTRGLLPRDRVHIRYYTGDGLKLTRSYALPGPWLLALFIFTIVLLVGPAAHLALAKAKRREWAWLAVPGLSLLLALAAYGVSSRVKGGTVFEVRHLMRLFEGLPEATVATSARVLSSKKQEIAVHVSAGEPGFDYSRGYSSYSREAKLSVELLRPDGIDLPDIPMQRFGFKDLSFISFAENPPAVEIHPSGESALVKNISAGELRDVFFHTGSGWLPVAQVLKQGQQAEVGPLTEAVDSNKLKPDWQAEGGGEQLAHTLNSAVMSRRSAFAVVARCGLSGFPLLSIEPAPDLAVQSAVCAWLKRDQEGVGP